MVLEAVSMATCILDPCFWLGKASQEKACGRIKMVVNASVCVCVWILLDLKGSDLSPPQKSILGFCGIE